VITTANDDRPRVEFPHGIVSGGNERYGYGSGGPPGFPQGIWEPLIKNAGPRLPRPVGVPAGTVVMVASVVSAERELLAIRFTRDAPPNTNHEASTSDSTVTRARTQ
jgi:hypothetical protein